MAINFEAANMAGYNNPEIYIFPVTVKIEGGASVVYGAPSYSTITNILKSGYIPFMFVTAPTGLSLLPLAAFQPDGLYQFSAAMFTGDSGETKMLLSIIVLDGETPALLLNATLN